MEKLWIICLIFVQNNKFVSGLKKLPTNSLWNLLNNSSLCKSHRNNKDNLNRKAYQFLMISKSSTILKHSSSILKFIKHIQKKLIYLL